MRQVLLGGESISRGLFQVNRAQSGDVTTLCVIGFAAFAVMYVGESSKESTVVAVFIAALGIGTCLPWEWLRPWTGGRSLRGMAAVRLDFRRRDLQGLTAFSPTVEEPVPSGVGTLIGTDHLLEDSDWLVGVLEPTRSVDRRGQRYLVTVVESQGDPGSVIQGLGERWSAFLGQVMATDVNVSHVIQVSSVTSWDPTDHVWLTGQDLERVSQVNPELVKSYAQVVDQVEQEAAMQRTWVVLRFPVRELHPDLSNEEVDEEENTEVDEDKVREEAARQTLSVIEQAEGLGLRMRPLSCLSIAALCRHLLCQDISPDDTRGLSRDNLGWLDVFPAFTTTRNRKGLVLETPVGRRWRSVWEMPAWTIEPTWRPADWLYPLLTNLSGKTHRVLSVACELEDARVARVRAQEDVTSDLAALSKTFNSVSDGEQEAQTTVSEVRRESLKVGTGNIGVKWSMALGFEARSAAELRANERHVLNALADCGIKHPLRMIGEQDKALALGLPLGRTWKASWTERLC